MKLSVNPDQSSLIKAYSAELVSDDFLHGRITAKMFTGNNEQYYLMKIYDDGRIVEFKDTRLIDFNLNYYEEFPLSREVKEAVDLILLHKPLKHHK